MGWVFSCFSPEFNTYAALREQAAALPIGNTDTQSSPVLYLMMLPVNFLFSQDESGWNFQMPQERQQ